MERGTGRTLAMVRDLPETGSIVVVHTARLRQYVTKMVWDLRGRAVHEVTRVVCCSDCGLAQTYLTGARRPIFVDHAFYDHAPQRAREMVNDMARGINAQFNGV